jgi:hypothetical protein
MMYAPIVEKADVSYALKQIRNGLGGVFEAQLLALALGPKSVSRFTVVLKRVADGVACEKDAAALEAEILGWRFKKEETWAYRVRYLINLAMLFLDARITLSTFRKAWQEKPVAVDGKGGGYIVDPWFA